MGEHRVMTTIPEDGWPTIPIVRPRRTDPTFTGGVIDREDEASVDAVLDFYRSVLVPQLACGPDGADPWPHKSWLMNPDKELTIVAVYVDGVMSGVWVIKEGAIFMPCVDPDHIAAAFRALWDESTKHVDYIYGTSDNVLIMKFAEAAMRRAPLPTSPRLSEDGLRVEWRRDA